MLIKEPLTQNTKARIWSVLPPLELAGTASPEVESVMSYLLRMAEVCGTTAFGLVSAACTLAPSTQYISHAAVSGRSPRFELILEGLKNLGASSDLACGSFWALRDVLAQRGLSRSSEHRRWCPECYSAWDPRSSYEPLIWCVSLVTTCLFHGCELIDKCPACRAPQKVSTPLKLRRKCCRCGESLACRPERRVETTIEKWQSAQCEQLITLCATPRSKPVPWANYLAFVQGLVEMEDAANILEWHHIRTNYEGIEVQKPTIKTLLSLAAFQGIGVAELLSDPMRASSNVLNQPRTFSWIPPPPPMYESKVMLALRFMADALWEGYGYVPPLDVVLKAFNVLRATINEADPELFLRYKRRYAAQGSAAQLGHLRRAFADTVLKLGRLRAHPCGKGTPRSVLAHVMKRVLNRETAEEIARAAFRLEGAYRGMCEES